MPGNIFLLIADSLCDDKGKLSLSPLIIGHPLHFYIQHEAAVLLRLFGVACEVLEASFVVNHGTN